MAWNDPVLALAARLLLAAVIGGAALHKLRDPVRFRETLRDYRLLPDALVVPAALAIALAELACVALLLAPRLHTAGAALAGALLLLYAGAIGANLARGRTEIDCGCSWGGGGQALSGWLLVRNAALLPWAALAASAGSGRAIGAADVAVAAAAALTLVLFYHAGDRLIANATALRALRVAHE